MNPSISPEAFFTNGSSYVLSTDTLQVQAGKRFSFSFRSCTTGDLIKQTGDNLDQLQIRISVTGSIHLIIITRDDRHDQTVGEGLLDGQWHTVTLEIGDQLDSIKLSVSVGEEVMSDVQSDASFGDILRKVDLTSTRQPLRFGTGMIACIREGPGLRFTKPGITITDDAVNWKHCLLPFTCEGN